MKLIITNGQSAVHTIKNAGIEAEIISWDDALHDGPVPGGKTLDELSEIRAKYISDIGWGTYEEIHQRFVERDNKLKQHGEYEELILWFEHDLYDQLQLMQILAWLYENRDQSTILTIACEEKFIAEQDEPTIQQMYKDRIDVLVDDANYAKCAWNVFCRESSKCIDSFIDDDGCVEYERNRFTHFMTEALLDYMPEFPWIRCGLTRSEWIAFGILCSNKDVITIGQLFKAYTKKYDSPYYLGDASFALYMTRLSNVQHPLLTFDNGEKIKFHPHQSTIENFWKRKMILTETGHQVLKRIADHIKLNGIDRWMGGYHLTNECDLRYDLNGEWIVKLSKNMYS